MTPPAAEVAEVKDRHRRPGPQRPLWTFLSRNPRVRKLLHDHGITFCAGCYLTLSATPERAAAYHGVPDIPRFLRSLDRARGGRAASRARARRR